MKGKNRKPGFLIIVSIIIYIFLWAPVVILILFSFSSHKFGVKWEHFTLMWYSEFFSNTAVKDALMLSLIVSSITVVVATGLGAVTAYGLYKFRFRGREILRTSVLLPIILPYVVTGASLLVFFTRLIRVHLGLPTILIAHITFSTPLAVFVILGRMQRINWSWEEAAMDLGATRFVAFYKIVAPLMLPAIAASAMLIFPWSFDDF
ncbi:MAG: ABC transporter permease, partial [Spirochaetota bacterium]